MRKRHIFMIACVCLYFIKNSYAQEDTRLKVNCGTTEENVAVPDATYSATGGGDTVLEACNEANLVLSWKIQKKSYYCPTQACRDIGGDGCYEEDAEEFVDREFEGEDPFTSTPPNCSFMGIVIGFEYSFAEEKYIYTCKKDIVCEDAKITAKCTDCPHGDCDKVSQDKLAEVGQLLCQERSINLFQSLLSL